MRQGEAPALENRSDLAHLPARLGITLVEVQEINCPPGPDLARWPLAAMEPVESEADLWRMVDLYRTQWLIEEFL